MGLKRAEPTEVSFQHGLPEEVAVIFHKELKGWFPALKWLIKEFRLRVGYETPDEEAGIQFWIDRYEQKGRIADPKLELNLQYWPTADESTVPGTHKENDEAKRWNRLKVADRLTKFFELKRKHCPGASILSALPATRKEQHANRTMGIAPASQMSPLPPEDANHVDYWRHISSKMHCAAGLHRFQERATTKHAVVKPRDDFELRMSKLQAAPTPKKPRALSAARQKQLTTETAARLFPTAVSRDRQLTDDQFVSRIVDFYIEFDGDPVLATRRGAELLSRGFVEGMQLSTQRRFVESRDDIQKMSLVEFWTRLDDKPAFGVQKKAEMAVRLFEKRSSGEVFGESVLAEFKKRFAYECLDAGMLYRFWAAMPAAIRSLHCLRGLSNASAFRMILIYAHRRAEQKQKDACKPKVDPDAQLRKTLTAAIFPFGTPRATGLDILATPKAKTGTLPFILLLSKQFPQDTTLRRMVRQSLNGRLPWRGTNPNDYEVYDVYHEMAMRNRMCYVPGKVVEDKEVAEKGHAHLERWMNADHDRATKTVEALKKTRELTSKIQKDMQDACRRFMRRGPKAILGPYFTESQPRPDSISSRIMMEDLFAKMCRKYGTWEVCARFGSHYLPMSQGPIPSGTRAPGIPPVLGQGGPTIDCSKRKAACDASSTAAGCTADDAVDGKAGTGWRPRLVTSDQLTWWDCDLGDIQNCVGVTLRWIAPRRTYVEYIDQKALLGDLLLRTSATVAQVIEVGEVKPGGVAARNGIASGDILIGAGRDWHWFSELEPQTALSRLEFPAMLEFESGVPVSQPQPVSRQSRRHAYGPLALEGATPLSQVAAPEETPPENKVSIVVKGSKIEEAPAPEEYEQVIAHTDKEGVLRMTIGEDLHVPVVFVARWVRLDFAGTWPTSPRGWPLLLSVSVIKVWQLAPPEFKREFLDTMRRKCKAGWMKSTVQPFFALGPQRKSFNRKVQREARVSERLRHDYDDPDEDLFGDEFEERIQGRVDNEFFCSKSRQVQSWRRRVFGTEDEIRECTFHPRAAANVPKHVLEERKKLPDDLLTKKMGIRGFADRLRGGSGELFESHHYPDYHYIFRKKWLAQARREFASGMIVKANQVLATEFNLDMILKHFTCFHPGCNMNLPTNAKPCTCAGFFCIAHAPKEIHDCKNMKARLMQEAKDQKRKAKEEGTKNVEEKFDEKRMLGLLLEVLELGEGIKKALQQKSRKRRDLVWLKHSLMQKGGVRLLENPMRTQICPTVLSMRRSKSLDAPLIGRIVPHCCDCEKAHHASQLRFPLVKSTQRHMAWVDKSLKDAQEKADVLPLSRAERKKLAKPKEEAGAGTSGRRKARSLGFRRRVDKLRAALDNQEEDANRAKGMTIQARALMQEGKTQQAALMLDDAKRLAYSHMPQPSGPSGYAPDAKLPSSPTQHTPKQLALKAQIMALAGSGDHKESLDRPLRACEEEELRRSQEAVHREVYSAVESCENLESELRKQRREQAYYEERALNSSMQLMHGDTGAGVGGLSPKQRYPDPLRDSFMPSSQETRGSRKLQMCVEFLDTRSCSRGENCPFAHQPGELGQRPFDSMHRLFEQMPVEY